MKIPKWLVKLSGVEAKCDLCGYREKIDISNITEEEVNNLLGKDCPFCGHNMIDENDIKKMKSILKSIHAEPSDKGTFTYRTKKH